MRLSAIQRLRIGPRRRSYLRTRRTPARGHDGITDRLGSEHPARTDRASSAAPVKHAPAQADDEPVVVNISDLDAARTSSTSNVVDLHAGEVRPMPWATWSPRSPQSASPT